MSRIPADPDFEPRVADWLEADPDLAPREVLATVLAAFPSIPQRRASRVPRRLPNMTLALRAAAAILVVAVIGGGALLFLRGSPNGGGVGAPPATASPSPSPSPMSVVAFTAAHNSICSDAAAALNPVKDRFVGVFDASLTEAQRTDWAAALGEFSTGYTSMIGKLTALRPPPELAADHQGDLDDLRAIVPLVDDTAAKLRAGDLVGAQMYDGLTSPYGQRVFDREQRHGFEHCP